jgi:hypothetical protein
VPLEEVERSDLLEIEEGISVLMTEEPHQGFGAKLAAEPFFCDD